MAVSQATLEMLITMKDQASEGISAIGSTLGTVGMVAGGVALAGVAAFGAAIVSGAQDAREANQIMAQTNAVLKSTGNAANTTADHVADLAAGLSAASGKSLFGDSDIQQSTNLLLTFTNIKEGALDAATAISVDMAQALGGAPKDAAVQLGKALNDPTEGITALTRVGVTFTAEQKHQIATMQEAGDMAGAQAVILAELNKEFGGSAQAAAEADGGWAQFNDRLGEAQETLGAAFLPIFNELVTVLNDTFMPLIEGAAATFADLVGMWDVAGESTSSFTEKIGFMIDTFMGVTDSIGPFQELGASIAEIWDMAGESTSSFTEKIGFMLDTFLGVTDSIGPFQELGAAISEGFGNAITGIAELWQTTLYPAMQEVIRVFQEQVAPILLDIAEVVIPLLSTALGVLGAFFENVIVPAVKMLWQVLTTLVLPALSILVAWLKEVLPPIIAVVAGFLTDTLFPAFKTAFDYISTNIIPAFANLKGNLSAFYDYYLQPIVDGFNAVVKAITDADQWLKNITGTLASIVIPDWLEGHSPPPLANWLNSIADAGQAAGDAAGGVGFGSGGGVPMGAALGGGSTSITVGQIVVQGAANPEQTALLVRNELLKLGNRNLDIFGGRA